MFSIAVLITCHNRKEKTLACLNNLFNQEGFNDFFKIDVFLVDDGSTDGTSDAVKNQFPKVKLINGNGKLFWNRGMCLAWETASKFDDFDYYLWLNDDVELFENAISNLLLDSEYFNDKAVICGSTVSKLKNIISYGGNDKNGKLLTPNGSCQQCYTFNGNILLVPRYVFEMAGIIDKFFLHAIGDFDYAMRLTKLNLKSYVSSYYAGLCEGHDKLPDWCLPEKSFIQRIVNLYSPLGNSHPYYYFIYVFRYYGMLAALKNLLTIHVRLVMPSLWIKKKPSFFK